MPRSRPVDYPQVHPPSAQQYAGLAPPPNAFADPNRFSWQNSSTDLVSQSHVAEQELEAGISGRNQEHRQSTVPPLPVLPNHLGGPEQQDNKYQASSQEKADYLSQQDLFIQSEVANQYYQQPPQQQGYQFRPDLPRHLQQQQQQQPQLQTELHRQPSGPPLSYEASQAQTASLHLQPHQVQTRMQEQPAYPGHYDGSQLAMSAHALPIHNTHQAVTTDREESTDQKPAHPVQPTQPTQQTQSVHLHRPSQPNSASSPPSRPAQVYIGPDVHPLSSTSPTHSGPHFIPPTNLNSTNINTSNTTNNQSPTFPQVTSYNPPSPHRPGTGGTWHTSLLSCSSPSICLSSLTCPCIIYGRTQYRLSQKSSNKDPTNMLGYSAVNGSCVAWSLLCGVNVLLTAIQHRRVRKMYEMQEGSGDVAGDCVRSLCCCCCVVALDEKEVKMREEGKSGDGKEGMVERGYTSPGGMMYSPPPR